MTQNELHVQRLMQMADDPARAARISKLARGVEKAMGDAFFGYLAYAVDAHSDMNRDSRVWSRSQCLKERDSCIRTAFAQAVP